MKKLIILILTIALLLPINVKALSYESENLEETLKEEAIEPEFKEYKPKNDAVTIYLFRGKGCTYCRAFLTFLNSITEEYGDYFVLESYEVWNNADNKTLMTNVSNFMNVNATGVPFIIIGDKTFTGYAESYNDKIKEAISSLYDTNKNKRYDVMKDYEKKAKKNNVIEAISNSYVLWSFIFSLISTIIIISFINIRFKELNNRIDALGNKKK